MNFQRLDMSQVDAPGAWHIDALQTNLLIAYRPLGFIADQILPVIGVQKQSNRFAKIDRRGWFSRPSTLRAPGDGAKEVSFTVSSDTYLCENFELATKVPWETLDNADAPHEVMTRAGEFLGDQLALDYEVRVQQTVVGGVGSSLTLTGANAWDAFATSDLLGNCDTAREAIRQSTGRRPNVCIMPTRTWLKVQRHPDVIRHVFPSGVGGGVAAPQQFGNLIGVERVLIPEAIQHTGAETAGAGDTGLAMTDVWSTNVTLLYVTPTAGLMVPTYGYSFRWTGPNIGGAGPGNFGVMTTRNENNKSTYLRAGYYQDEKIVAAELGFNIVTGIA